MWEHLAHPYTRALIAAVPRHDGSRTLPVALEGEVPDPARPPSGCRFHPRCPERVERCFSESPELEPVGESHDTACWVAVNRVALTPRIDEEDR